MTAPTDGPIAECALRAAWAASDWARLFPSVRLMCLYECRRAQYAIDADELDDLVALTMWRCVQQDVPLSPLAFVRVVARRILIDRRTKTAGIRWMHHSLQHVAHDQHEALQEQAPSALDAIIADETRTRGNAALHAALAQLSPAQRLILEAHDLEGASVAEVADRVGATVDQMKMRLHRARHSLKQSTQLNPNTLRG